MNKMILNIGVYFVYTAVLSVIFGLLLSNGRPNGASICILLEAILLIVHIIITLILSIIEFREKKLFQEYIISILFLLLLGFPGCYLTFVLLIKSSFGRL